MSDQTITSLIEKLSPAQRYHVERGCISGDFTMNTVNALKRKGLFHLVISSPNGQCGFMEPTDLGKRVRAQMLADRAQSEARV